MIRKQFFPITHFYFSGLHGCDKFFDLYIYRLLKIFRSFTTFNSRYTNNMPKFFATNLHFPAAIEFALVSLYVVAFPSLEPATPCIT